MRWYFPSWNGDLRLEPDPANPKQTLLSVVEPTAHESKVLVAMESVFRTRGWWAGDEPLYTPPKKGWLRGRQKMIVVTVDATLADIGPVVARHMKPGASTLTAIRFEGGKILAVEGVESELADVVREAMGDAVATKPAEEPPPAAGAALAAKVAAALEDQRRVAAALDAKPAPVHSAPVAPAAAATVQRPTPCCPRCIPGAVEPASEVLLDFLTPEQHESWAKDRCIIAVGGFTGVRYLLAHRHTPRAQKIGRVCYSLDDEAVVHFHQTEVPPEEEILAAKLILELREDWLRNEATLFTPDPKLGVFKNPFGGINDGIADADFMARLGRKMGFSDGEGTKAYQLTTMISNPFAG